MAAETTKSTKRRIKDPFFQNIFKGNLIDIGAGEDILDKNSFENIESVEDFDLKDGDAQKISQSRKENSYDVVHSSQCLEHMRDVNEALNEWIKITKEGGHLVITIPDFHLYEQGNWPSIYNHDHKFTFTIESEDHQRGNHINVKEWLEGFTDKVDVLRVDLIDTNYDYSKKNVDQTRGDAEAFIEIVLRKKYLTSSKSEVKSELWKNISSENLTKG